MLAAALDTGTALSGIFIFFCVSYPGGKFPNWWGNTGEFTLQCIVMDALTFEIVFVNTDDGDGTPYLNMPAAGYFGPANGTWS